MRAATRSITAIGHVEPAVLTRKTNKRDVAKINPPQELDGCAEFADEKEAVEIRTCKYVSHLSLIFAFCLINRDADGENRYARLCHRYTGREGLYRSWIA
jgi:hypothetical protein